MKVITMSEPCRCCGGTEYVCAECDYEPLEAQHDALLAACELQEHADRLRTVWLCNQAVPGYDSSGDRRAWHEALGLAEEARRAAIAKARGNDVPDAH